MSGFNLQAWSKSNTSMNLASPSTWVYSGVSPYLGSTTPNTDTIADITASGYFNTVFAGLQVDDLIYAVGADADSFLTVAGIDTTQTPPVVTTTSFSTSGVIGTANIEDAAVTAAKIATGTITATQIAATTITGALLVNNTITSTQLALNVLQHLVVDLNNTQVLGMAATPVTIVGAPGANLLVVVDKCVIRHNFVTGAFTGTPNIGLQYGATADLAGTAASGVISATGLFSTSANAVGAVAGALAGSLVTGVANTAVTISAASALTVGGGNATVEIWYKVVATTGD